MGGGGGLGVRGRRVEVLGGAEWAEAKVAGALNP